MTGVHMETTADQRHSTLNLCLNPFQAASRRQKTAAAADADLNVPVDGRQTAFYSALGNTPPRSLTCEQD